jgi:hypothetical protein
VFYIIAPPLSKNFKNCARRKSKDLQIPASTGTSFIQPLRQGLGLLLSFIPNQPLSRQAKSLKAISKKIHLISHLPPCIFDFGRVGTAHQFSLASRGIILGNGEMAEKLPVIIDNLVFEASLK